MERIGFIGMGNMARAIAEGFLRSGAVPAERMSACAKRFDRLEAYCAPKGIHPCRDAAEVIARSDAVIVAVKPYLVEEVLRGHTDALKDKVVLSVATGWTHAKYRALLDASTRVQYIMPNTPCGVGEGVLLFEEEHSLTEDEHAEAERLFSALGVVQELPTHLMGAATAITGCGPAFAAMMIEALADGGVKHGLPRATAYRLASQMLIGTGKLQLATGAHPGAMKDAVCSPAGTTIRGVEALEANGFRHAVIEAVSATLK